MSTSDYPCDLCGTADAIPLPDVLQYTGGQPIHVCTRCGLVYVKRRRSPTEVAAYWSNTMLGVHYTARIPALKARQVFIAETIDVTLGLKGKRVCDIGTGEGQFLEIIRRPEYGAVAFGTEASPSHCAALARAGIECFCGTAEEFLQSGVLDRYRADIVTLIWTLESSTSCRTLLEAASRILVPGGHIVVATGSRILVPFRKPLYLYLEPRPLDVQPLRFSANTLRGMLAVNGFETLTINRFIDHDVLCVIARKREAGASIPWQGDDPAAVVDFFARWHRETASYPPSSAER